MSLLYWKRVGRYEIVFEKVNLVRDIVEWEPEIVKSEFGSYHSHYHCHSHYHSNYHCYYDYDSHDDEHCEEEDDHWIWIDLEEARQKWE